MMGILEIHNMTVVKVIFHPLHYSAKKQEIGNYHGGRIYGNN